MGRLSKPTIKVHRTQKCWGYVVIGETSNSKTIDCLTIHYNQPSLKHFIEVLAHEMVHIWQVQINGDTGAHNSHFYSWREEFNTLNLKLARSM